jgi:hypothetical protein
VLGSSIASWILLKSQPDLHTVKSAGRFDSETEVGMGIFVGGITVGVGVRDGFGDNSNLGVLVNVDVGLSGICLFTNPGLHDKRRPNINKTRQIPFFEYLKILPL